MGGDNDKAEAGLFCWGKDSVPSQLYHQNGPRDSLRVESLRESSDTLAILRSQILGCHNRLRTYVAPAGHKYHDMVYDCVIHLITYDPVCNHCPLSLQRSRRDKWRCVSGPTQKAFREVASGSAMFCLIQHELV